MGKRGYRTLLNLSEQPHWTVFVSDFPLRRADLARLRRQLRGAPTRSLFLRIDHSRSAMLQKLRSANITFKRDYVSLQGIVFRQTSLTILHELFAAIHRGDFTTLELPFMNSGFCREFATQLLRVVARADYLEQDRIAERFFSLLARHRPYHVAIETAAARLHIRDSRPWFDFSGRLREREVRILPGGEVAYTGEQLSGSFVIDGAILPQAQHAEAAVDVLPLQELSSEVSRQPLRLEINNGKVVELRGRGRAAQIISRLFESDERYRRVTEVGISFNRACDAFIHDWPAVSNEERPGVHVGIGGAGDARRSRGRPMLHIDFIAANCKVLVNRHPFLRAASRPAA